jgi:multiple sugar transport system ATP-binding protein
LGSRIAVMKDGVLQKLGTPDDIYNRPANTYVATFIGSPTMNLLNGRSLGAQGVALNGANVTLNCPAATGQDVVMGLRPEHLVLSDAPAWRGQVSVVEPTGADTYVVIETAQGNVTVRTTPNMALRPGDTVGLEVNTAHVSWFDAAGVRI